MTSLSSDSPPRIVVVGGGLAGIAAAAGLAEHGCRVQLVESRSQLGGRAGSFIDKTTGEVIDNCQHVSMGCCTNLRQLCRSLNLDAAFETQRELYFIGPQGTITPFRESPWLPAPLHLTRAFLQLPYLTFREKRFFSAAVKSLAQEDDERLQGVVFSDWLYEQQQTDRLIRCVWEVVLISALSESLDRVDASYARKVFVDGFLAHRAGWRVEIPTRSLTEIYSTRAAAALRARGVDVLTSTRVRQLNFEDERLTGVELTDDRQLTAEDVILAVPHHQLRRLFPEPRQGHPSLRTLDAIETAPITSVHLWFDRPITSLPHAVLIDRFSQWLFSRGHSNRSGRGDQYAYQVVISASRNVLDMEQDDVVDPVRRDLESVWPEANQARLIHARVITEKRAVFSTTPGIDTLRPEQQSWLPQLQFAGDWTRTGWPSTMEGAVRSGYLAAQNVLHRHGCTTRLLAADLQPSWLARRVLGLSNKTGESE